MDLVPTGHANEQMLSRDISWAQVVETVENFEVTYDSRGDQMFQRGAIAVVTTRPASDGFRVVKTVLLRQATQWNDEDARRREGSSPRRPVVRQSTARPRPSSSPAPVPSPVLVPAPVPKPGPRLGKHRTF